MESCLLMRARKDLEARGGIEPPNKGFADLCLTTWLPRLALNLSLSVRYGSGSRPESQDQKTLAGRG